MWVYKFIFSFKKTNHIRETISAKRENISGPNVCQNSSCNLKEKIIIYYTYVIYVVQYSCTYHVNINNGFVMFLQWFLFIYICDEFSTSITKLNRCHNLITPLMFFKQSTTNVIYCKLMFFL
jgi:hypothetical protein